MTHADRFAAGLQATWTLYVAAVIILALAYLVVRMVDYFAAKRANPYLAPYRNANREPGELPEVEK